MDSIKKKMEKLANETAEAEARIANYEAIKASNYSFLFVVIRLYVL